MRISKAIAYRGVEKKQGKRGKRGRRKKEAKRRRDRHKKLRPVQNASASANFAAYDSLDNEYNPTPYADVPYIGHLRRLAELNQSLTSVTATASITLANNRNAVDAAYNLAVGPKLYDRDVKFADAAKDRGRDAATADRNAAVDRAAASQKFYLDSAGPATTYATETATALATHAIDVATAVKTLVYEQVDEVAEANTNYDTALTTAIDKETTDLATARTAWRAAEANAHADLRIASATADRNWSVAILTADKTRITEENNAQKTLRDAQSNAYQVSETAWAEHEKTFYLAEVDASALLTSGLSDPWSVRADSLRSGRAPSDRNRLTASLMLTTAEIANQRNLELAHSTAEATFRNNSVLSTLTANTTAANASLTSVTTSANAHRTAATPSSQPAATAVIEPRYGTLGIASQISPTMSATAWIAVTDRVIARMNDWVSDLYSSEIAYGLDLGSEILNQPTAPSTLASNVANALSDGIEGLENNLPSRASIPRIENPLIASVESGNNFGAIAFNIASIFANSMLPNWFRWGASFAYGIGTSLLSADVDVSVTQTRTWSQVRVLDHIRSITPEVANWIQRRQGIILFRQAAGSDVTFQAVTEGSDGNAFVISIGIGLDDIHAAKLILLRVGTMVSVFKQVVVATRPRGIFGYGESPWSDTNIGKAPDSFAAVTALVASKQQNINELEAELQKRATALKIAVSITPAGELYAFVEAAANNDPLGATLAGGGVVLTVAGTAYKLSKSHNLGSTKVYKLDEMPTSGIPSAIKFEGATPAGSGTAASLAAEAFEKAFSSTLLQAAYRQIKRAEFEVILVRTPQPSWADDAGVVLKGFADPATRTVTIYLVNLKNADEVAEVLAHESKHVIDFLRHGTMTPHGTQAAEIAADLRAWIVANGRRPNAAEHEASIISTIIRIRNAGYKK